jgi:Spy/CpxP family protein refolding chaperone
LLYPLFRVLRKQDWQGHLNREATTMKRLVLLIMAGVLVASNASAFRGGPGMGPGCGLGSGYGMGPRWAASLDLTEDQQAQIQAKQEAFQTEVDPLRDKLFSKRMELRNLWAQASPDQSTISVKQTEIQALQNQLQAKATQLQLECRELLTPEQQEKLATTVGYRGGQGGRGYHGGQGGGPGWGMRTW